MFSNLYEFMKKLFKVCRDNELPALANELTYRLLIAFFPFIIFLMSLIGFFNINSVFFMQKINGAVPDMIYKLISLFVTEVVEAKNAGLLSLSLIITLYSASSGFNAIIKGINRAYGIKEKRNFIISRALSIFLALIFALAIILSIAFLVFGNVLISFILPSTPGSERSFIYGFLGYFVTMLILLIAIIIIYRMAIGKKPPLHSLIPGALTTLIVWILASKVFNIYINNFARFSKIYGSLASIIILIYWINILSLVLLIGGAINALLDGDPTTP